MLRQHPIRWLARARRPAPAWRLVAAVVAALAVLAAPASAAERRVPFGFMGMAVNSDPGQPDFRQSELELMVSSGVESLRTAFNWSVAQPYRRREDVPPDQLYRFQHEANGVPTDFGPTDRIVEAAARRHLRVLPAVLVAPPWAARHPYKANSPPRGPQNYARFMGALVRRYGANGSFWRERGYLPRLPIRDWQIWNEPNQHLYFWSDQPFAPTYVVLVREARRAIKREDPGARVILAGLVGESDKALAEIYRQRGARGYFDVVAIHPFTRRVKHVVQLLDMARRVMRRYGDARKPLVVTELSWPSAHGRLRRYYGSEVTEREQAERVVSGYRTLAANRRRLNLKAVYWFTWSGSERPEEGAFAFAGLRKPGRRSGTWVSKPALGAFRSTARYLEGCAKSTIATRCR